MKMSVLTIFIALLLDQLLKIWIKLNWVLGEYKIVFSWFRIYFIENEGMAFGFVLPFGNPEISKLILSLFRIIAVIFIGYYLYQLIKEEKPKGLIFSLSIILAGAIGNILDSMFYGLFFSKSSFYTLAILDSAQGYAPFLHGRVVDMFQFTVQWPDFIPYLGGSEIFPPIFNLADSYITLGVAFIILFQRQFFLENINELPEENK